MRTVISGTVFALVAMSMAQAPKTRIDSIWASTEGRMIQQQDIWFDDGEYLADIQLLKEEAERWTADYEIWTNLGWMEENVEMWDQALATYVRYRRDNPQDPDGALPEADYFARKKLWTKLPELLEPAINKKGCHPNNFRLLASAYEHQKMYADSIRVWKSYLIRDPNDGAAKNNLKRVEKKLAGGT